MSLYSNVILSIIIDDKTSYDVMLDSWKHYGSLEKVTRIEEHCHPEGEHCYWVIVTRFTSDNEGFEYCKIKIPYHSVKMIIYKFPEIEEE